MDNVSAVSPLDAPCATAAATCRSRGGQSREQVIDPHPGANSILGVA
jgi:hypothetical protein